MEQHTIFGPFFAMFALTFVVWMYMYVRRIHFFQTMGIKPVDVSSPAALAALTPPRVANPSDNLKNLFEIPVLFYALVLYLFATNQVDATHLYAAWIFVGFRVLHSAVHCTFNLVLLRFWIYAISTIALWFMVFRSAWAWLAV